MYPSGFFFRGHYQLFQIVVSINLVTKLSFSLMRFTIFLSIVLLSLIGKKF